MKTINVATDLFESIEVILWDGEKYSVRQPTRSVEKKVAATLEQIEGLPEDSNDEAIIDALCDLLNIFLEPIPDEDGKKTQAKTVVKKAYAAEKIGLAHVEALFEKISDLRAERPN